MSDDKRHTMGWPAFLGWLILATVALGEWAIAHPPQTRHHLVPQVAYLRAAATAHYSAGRTWLFTHWGYALVAVVALLPLALVYRRLLQWWHNEFLAGLQGTDFGGAPRSFPKRDFSLVEQIAATPRGRVFLGLAPSRKPVTVDDATLGTHLHVLGPTGCGKTEGLLFPLMLQDALAGKGLAFIEAKGSQSAIERFRAIAVLARRSADVRIFSLEFPAHSYNPVHLGRGGDPLAVAERIFADFAMDNEYYRGQAKLLFYNLVRLMAGTAQPFNLIDLRLAVGDDAALDHVMSLSDDRRAKYAISQQLHQLGKRRLETFTGLYNALADYDPGGPISEALNAYNPDIVLEDLVDSRQMAYFHLSTNRYQLLAPAVGKLILRHLTAVGAARDARPAEHDGTPFSISIDEAQNFLSDSLLDALTMLRSAKMQVRLAHQTPAQLQHVSEAFEATVRTNTRCKVLFGTDDPNHAEVVARSYGTYTTFKKTVKFSPGPLLTHLNSGEASNREVQEFRIHPDMLKNLAACGQAYVLSPDGAQPVSFSTLPPVRLPVFAPSRKPSLAGLDLYKKFVDASQRAASQ